MSRRDGETDARGGGRRTDTVGIRFPIPGGAAQSPADFCKIVFRHKSVYSPAEDGTRDARRLGFAVRSISLTPLPGEAATPAGEPYQDIASDEVVPARDFGFADGATALRLPPVDADVIELQPELVSEPVLAELHTDQTRRRARPRRGRPDVRRSPGRSA